MAILFSQADGSDQHYDTYEEFEQAFILLKRLNGEKVPQDLLDEVKAKYGVKESAEELTYSINVDTSDLTKKLDEVITDLIEEISAETEEAEPLLTYEDIEVGDKVRIISAESGISDTYHHHAIGRIGTVTWTADYGSIGVELDGHFQVVLPDHVEKAVALGKDANGEDLYEGDFVTGSGDSRYFYTDETVVMEVLGDGESVLFKDANILVKIVGNPSDYNVNSSKFIKLSDSLDEAKAKFDELKHVEEGSTEFRTGDIVLVTESFSDHFGDRATEGAVYEYDENFGMGEPFVGTIYLGDNIDKLELVCRREDRKD